MKGCPALYLPQGAGEGIPADEFGQPWRLRRGLLPLLADEDCSRIYQEGADFTTQETMECAGGCPAWPDSCPEGRAACNGDSGGPLVCQGGDGRWYQVRQVLLLEPSQIFKPLGPHSLPQAGIVSFGPKPCDTQIPTVFTRVAGYRYSLFPVLQHTGSSFILVFCLCDNNLNYFYEWFRLN